MTVIIILGAARSGTKFLRELLGSASTATAVADGVNSIWRIGNEHSPDDALEVDSITPQQKKSIRHAILAHSNSQTNFLVEKTSANTLRLDFVRSIFPEAKYVHLVRDGRAVSESALRQWKSANRAPSYYVRKFFNLPLRAYYGALRSGLGKLSSSNVTRPWGPVYPGMQQDILDLDPLSVCARQWSQCVGRCTRAISSNSNTEILEVRYEDLLSDSTVLAGICEHLGLPVENVQSTYDRIVDRSDVAKWQRVLVPADVQSIEREASDLLEHWGYLG